jgi:hypothetical protein
MTSTSSVHAYLNWAKERIDEMDAALASLESKAGEVQADARGKATQLRAQLTKKRDDFRETVKKQTGENEAVWMKAKAQLDSDWTAFETELTKYVDSFSAQLKQQQATFKAQADAQVKAWREAAEKFRNSGMQFATERRTEIEASAKRMDADAAAAQAKLQKLNEAGAQSWSIFMGALKETRTNFDRANQAAQEAFKKAAA